METNDNSKKLTVHINGKNVATNPFVETIFTNIIEAMVHSLKLDDYDIHSIKIEIEKKGKS